MFPQDPNLMILLYLWGRLVPTMSGKQGMHKLSKYMWRVRHKRKGTEPRMVWINRKKSQVSLLYTNLMYKLHKTFFVLFSAPWPNVLFKIMSGI